jgi:hypothetical protein
VRARRAEGILFEESSAWSFVSNLLVGGNTKVALR